MRVERDQPHPVFALRPFAYIAALQPADMYDVPRNRQLADLQVQVAPAKRTHLASPKPGGGAQPQEQAEGRVLFLRGGQGVADLGRGGYWALLVLSGRWPCPKSQAGQ